MPFPAQSLSTHACEPSLQSSPILCDPVVCSPPGSSVHGILQARILEWVAMPPPGDLPNPGIKPVSLTSTCIGRKVLYHKSHLGSPPKHAAAAAKSLQLCPTLCDPIDTSPSRSPVPGILQARTLEWVAISFSNA